MFEWRDDPGGRIAARAKPPHAVLRKLRLVRAFAIPPWRKASLAGESQVRQGLRPAAPFIRKGGGKDNWDALQRRRPLRPLEKKPRFRKPVDPEHLALMAADQLHDFRWRMD